MTSTAMDMDIDTTEEDDPIIASYSIFMTPQLKEQLILLQYPNRERASPYDAANRALPGELRIKPTTGFLELDIGISTSENFDKLKGIQYGSALKHARDSKSRGFGLSGGFGKGDGDMKVLVSGGKGRGDDMGDHDRLLREFDERAQRDAVMTRQTLGGMIRRPEKDKPLGMVGTFKGDELHLTELTGTTIMRPQFHHIDAQASITRTSMAHSRSSAPPKSAQPVAAVTSTARTNQPEDTMQNNYKATEDFLNATADENWKRCWYRDEMEEGAFGLFEEKMILKDEEAREAKVRSEWGRDAYLEAIRTGGPEEVVERPRKIPLAKGKGKVIKKEPGVAGSSKR